jgi:hypothetical protein
MGATYNFHPRFAEGSGSKAETPDQLLNRQPRQKIWTGMSLVSLSLGFSVFGILIILNRHRTDLNGLSGDSFAATVGGITAILVGIAFLVALVCIRACDQTFCYAVGRVPICPFNFLETQVSHANRMEMHSHLRI